MVARESFFDDQGPYIPEDLCPFVADLPAKWTVSSSGDENLPELDEEEVRNVSL